MQPGTAWGGLPKSLSAFPVPATNYKRALKLSLAAAVFSAFLCLPLAAGWVNCSDSGTIVPCERAMGTPVCGGSLARPCRLPREQRGGPGTGSTAAPWWPGDGPCMSHIVPGSVSAHPLCPLGILEIAWKCPIFGSPRVSLLTAVQKVQTWVTCPVAGAPWPKPPLCWSLFPRKAACPQPWPATSWCPVLYRGPCSPHPGRAVGCTPQDATAADGLVLCPTGRPPATLLCQRL